MSISVRILGTPDPQQWRRPTSHSICELRASLGIRGLRLEPWARRLPGSTFVEITSTPCRFGAARWWLICPRCHRHCTVLYGNSCRLCRGAVHKTIILSPEDRLLEKALKIRRRLGQTWGGTPMPFPPRPKHMHRTSDLRLWRECRDAEQPVAKNISKAIGLVLLEDEPEELAPSGGTTYDQP